MDAVCAPDAAWNWAFDPIGVFQMLLGAKGCATVS
jgi:hypothetical protein